jgi:sulfite exporter TauE/SafE/copper chaperone CopZ
MKKIFKIEGMNCNSCAHLIETELKDKVEKVSVSYSDEKAEIEFDENKITEEQIISDITKLGYMAVTEKESEKTEHMSDESKSNEKDAQETAEQDNPANIEEKKKSEAEDDLIILKSSKDTQKDSSLPKDETKPLQPKRIKSQSRAQHIKEIEENRTFIDKLNNSRWIPLLIALIFLLFFLYRSFGFNINISQIKIPGLGEKTSLMLLFLAGILTGFHCVGMCGGFVVSYTTKNALNGHKSFRQHLVYGGSKVISYMIIGGLFGAIGGVIAFSIGLRSIVAILAGIFMIFYALSMFGVKFFKRFQFNPKFLTKVATEASNSAKGPYKTPFITGLLNGLFIACGPLQAMYLYAAGSGSVLTGATSLAAFGLGTLPVMLGFGSLATVISHKTTKRILKISAIIVLILGLIMVNRGLTLTGSPFSFDAIKEKIVGSAVGQASVSGSSNIFNGLQEINMNVDAGGYSPNSFVLKKGVPVKWNVNVKQLTGCNSELVLNDYRIDRHLKSGMNVIEFTPDKTGTIRFSCGMGMLRGSFIVTETGEASQQQIKAATPPAGMQCGGSGGGGCGCGG